MQNSRALTSQRTPKDSRTALLFGATGLVGGHCLDLLLADEIYGKVITIGRRNIDRDHPKLEHHSIDFERLIDYVDYIAAEDVFCCLGTTIKKAGSQEAFRKVDFTYPHELAKIAKSNGAEQFLLVSSIGADAKSSIFYNRVKGELEEAIRRIPFDAFQIFRPSLLLGEREETRLGEQVAEKVLGTLSFLFIGPLAKYKPIHASTVAAAMVRIAKAQPRGVNIYESSKIHTLSCQNLVI